MMNKLLQAAILVAGGLALGGCPMDQAKTSAPIKKAPAPDYQAASSAPPPPANRIKAICYSDADLSIVRGRMLQMELNVATLQCQTAAGGRAFESLYSSFLAKFTAELSTNARTMQQMAGRKRFNFDVVITEFANRTAQQAPVDGTFCARSQRALEWSLDAKVSSLAQAPPPYDLGPDMNIFPCPSP